MKKYPIIFLLVVIWLTSCSEQELDGPARLRPNFFTGIPATRSIINGTAPTTQDGRIHQVGMYITQPDHTPYPGITSGISCFTLTADNKWIGIPEVKLHNTVATLYAYYPAEAKPTPTSGSDGHTIPVTIPATQTFNGTNNWQCSTTDYLYGSGSADKEAAYAAITASNTKFEPSIYLHHALAQLVFQMQTASGRPVEEYDRIKKITLTATTHLFKVTTGSGSMQIKNGTLANTETVGELTFSPTPLTSAVLCGDRKAEIVGYGLVGTLDTDPADRAVTLTILLGKTDTNNNERELSATLPTLKWSKGNRYIYNITLSNRAISVGETTITAWTPEGGSGSLLPDGF